MRRVDLITDGRPAHDMPSVSALWRLEPTDDGMFGFIRYFASEDLAWRARRDNDRPYSANFHASSGYNLSRSWGYYFDFEDGTHGACQVRQVTQALAALGCRINIHSEPSSTERRRG